MDDDTRHSTGRDRGGMRGALRGVPTEAQEAILDLVSTIPPGRVVSYGLAAELAGLTARHARLAGSTMAHFGSGVPWWRVVQADGRLPQGLEEEARAHHREEGTPFVGGLLTGRRIDMARALWDGPDEQEDEGGR
ncbi:MGMT family protein [Janibacter sp. G56]|uniref:MGMT family protein n=1 Tax=Janibacter sp. G56 TaxID=3418717 RepID=UPI003D04A92C